MKIVCLGSEAQDTIDAANRRYSLTSNTAQNMVDFFNTNGGSTPLKASSPLVAKDEPGFFEKAWGIFEKLGTIASPAPVVHTVKSNPPPLALVLGLGMVGYALYKVGKS